MILKGMLKWAVGKDDRPINSTKSLKKRRKLQVDMQRGDSQTVGSSHVGLISGCCKHRNNNNNPQGPSRFLHHKNRHRVVGVVNNNNHEENPNLQNKIQAQSNSSSNNVPDNNNSTRLPQDNNYEKIDEEDNQYENEKSCVDQDVPLFSLQQNNNNNNVINADSKSLLYMSLDHLPMAIVKQYERMLQDAPLKPPPQSILKSRHSITNCSNNTSNTVSNSNNNHNHNHHHRPSNNIIKIQNQPILYSSSKKTHSKSVTLQEQDNRNQPNKLSAKNDGQETKSETKTPALLCPVLDVNLNANCKTNAEQKKLNIKEAHNRPLKVLSSSSLKVPTLSKQKASGRKSKTPSPEAFHEKYPCSSVNSKNTKKCPKKGRADSPKELGKVPKAPCRKESLLCDEDRSKLAMMMAVPKLTLSTNIAQLIGNSVKVEGKTKPVHSGDYENALIEPNALSSPQFPLPLHKAPTDITSNDNANNNNGEAIIINETESPPPIIVRNGVSSTTGTGYPHDTTDPQFLEKSITYSTPHVAKCARKLTLKRSELRKLERLKTQTEKLNRFLRKYYHDCLPNLPEEEEGQCSPEEKSLSISILRTHWQEVKSNDGCGGNNTTNIKGNTLPPSVRSNSYYNDINKNPWRAKHSSSTTSSTIPRSNKIFSPLLSSSYINAEFDEDNANVDDNSVRWQNLRNAASLISHSNDSVLLPIIQEDSAEVSSSNSTSGSSECNSRSNSESQSQQLDQHQLTAEMGRRESHATIMHCNNDGILNDSSFLMSSANILNADDSFTFFTKQSLGLSSNQEKYDRMSDNVVEKISYDDVDFLRIEQERDDEKGGFGMKKLKGLLIEPLGDLFDLPASLAEDEGFMSPYPPEAYSPASSTSTFNRFSVSSSGKGSGSAEEEDPLEHENLLDEVGISSVVDEEHDEGDYDDKVEEEILLLSNFPHTQSSSVSEITSEEGGSKEKYIIMKEMKHENANYLLVEDQRSCNSSDSNSNCNGNNDETWNSHGYLGVLPPTPTSTTTTSPCGSLSLNSQQPYSHHLQHHNHHSLSSSSTTTTTASTNSICSGSSSEDLIMVENERENEDDEESSFVMPKSGGLALAFSTPIISRLRRRRLSEQISLEFGNLSSRSYRLKKSTPRKLVRKPPVNSPFSGEVLIRTYKNGDYVTVHVVQARRLQAHYRSSWKLSIKVSLLPEAETTFTTRSESILVPRNRSWAKIDQKFSFEIPTPSAASEEKSVQKSQSNRKVFLTFVKRLEKRTFFLGWTTWDLGVAKDNTQCWLKLRKRKMSTTAYPLQSMSSGNHCPSSSYMSSSAVTGGIVQQTSRNVSSSNNGPIMMMQTPSPPLSGSRMDGASPSTTMTCDCDMEPKSQLQNSSTMDSGVEDCCEQGSGVPTLVSQVQPPPPPVPSIDLDDKAGQRVTVKMLKQDGTGYGFSVVWVTPPRIERLEKGKTADVAGLKIGDLIIGVNGEDVSTEPNTTIYTKMKTTGNELELEVWRKRPQAQSRPSLQGTPAKNLMMPPSSKSSSMSPAMNENHASPTNSNEGCQNQNRETQQSPCAACLPQNNKNSSTNATTITNSSNPLMNRIQSQPPPISILKPPPPAPPATVVNPHPSQIHHQQQQPPPSSGSSSWRIRFNIELLDNEDDCLKQFFICELKFFRKVVAALDRYLIPAQANRLLTPQEINLMFSHVIKIITVTKRILNCVANGSSSSQWNLGRILLSTHSDHLSEIVAAYSSYAKTLGHSAMILSEKMSIQEFARFVLETPVPKGHLDMTSLLFAPFEHLRNICEICEEISHNNEDWLDLSIHLKECYADIVCETDFMEPISHISMKKNPLLSVRDLEKRIVSTTCQALKVSEKGRRWLFGSRLFKKESDGSWTPVWAFLFSDIIVLTSHTTRDRVFFVKEAPIRLEDVVTLHFNLPKKHENEFRLLFGPEPVHQSRFDKILPIHRNKKSNQIILRTPNVQLKSVWKLLLQKQIITLNTRLSKSSSSNFSISEFCERFPITPQDEEDDKEDKNIHHPLRQVLRGRHQSPKLQKGVLLQNPANNAVNSPNRSGNSGPSPQNTIFDRQNYTDERNLSVIKEEKSYSQTIKSQNHNVKPYAPDGLSSMSKDLLKSRVTRIPPDRSRSMKMVEVIPEEIKVATQPMNDPCSDIRESQNVTQEVANSNESVKSKSFKTAKLDQTTETRGVGTSTDTEKNIMLRSGSAVNRQIDEIKNSPRKRFTGIEKEKVIGAGYIPSQSDSTARSNEAPFKPLSINNNNNNEVGDFNLRSNNPKDKCPCEAVQEKPAAGVTDADVRRRYYEEVTTHRGNNDHEAPSSTKKSFYESSPYYPSASTKQSTEIKQTTTVIKEKVRDEPGIIIMEQGKDRNELSRCHLNDNGKNNKGKTLVADTEPLKTEIPLLPPPSPSLVSHQGEQQQLLMRERLQRNSTPSPSMSNNRVEALKYYEGVTNNNSPILKPKPGSRILTNSTLKSRQQEIIQANNNSSLNSSRTSSIEAIIHDKSDSSEKALPTVIPKSNQNGNKAKSSNPTVMKDASSSPILSPPRCQSENGHVKSKPVHTDSPIMSGFGSDRSRRRILYDYKIQRDYPELFGITPKDRRSYIKRLAEKQLDNEKSLVAPYYFSPLPTHKFAKRSPENKVESEVVTEKVATSGIISESSESTRHSIEPQTQARKSPITPQQVTVENNQRETINESVQDIVTQSEPLSLENKTVNDHIDHSIVEEMGIGESNFFVEGEDIDDKTDDNDISLKEIVRGMLRNNIGGNDHESDEGSDEDSDDDDDDADDDESGGHEVRAQVHRHRSPEESSNDSGISDELTEKSKATTEEKERFQSNMAVNSSEVIKNKVVNFSPKPNNIVLVKTQNSDCEQMQMLPKAHACNSNENSTPNQNNKIDDLYFVEGEEEAGMEEMVVLKADKCTGTDDDYFNASLPWPHYSKSENHNKSMRTLMAERREAFFASYQSSSIMSSSSGPSSLKSVPENEPPLIVKIVDGGTLHSTIPEPKATTPPTERVQLARLPEKEKTARVERVESSDDSTSSDIASASPAAENGTTDPSWSSSSSSLAGYASSKEEQSTSAAATVFNSNDPSYSLTNDTNPNNGQSFASTSSRISNASNSNVKMMSDVSNGLPSSSFSSFSHGSLFSNYGGGPEIVVTQESPDTPTAKNGYSSDGEEEDSILCNGKKAPDSNNDSHSSDSERKSFLRVESNDSTAENYGDDDDYNFDDEDDLSQCSVATINRYGTYESLEKIESEDSVGGLPDFSRPMPRSKARFTFEDEDSDDDNDLFEEDFESDFNFRFPSQIQDNTYSVSRLGPLPPLLEEDFEDEMYDEQRVSGGSPSSSAGTSANSGTSSTTLRSRHETGLRHDNGFLLARLATMYARSSISPLKILRELWLKKRYRQNWAYKE